MQLGCKWEHGHIIDGHSAAAGSSSMDDYGAPRRGTGALRGRGGGAAGGGGGDSYGAAAAAGPVPTYGDYDWYAHDYGSSSSRRGHGGRSGGGCSRYGDKGVTGTAAVMAAAAVVMGVVVVVAISVPTGATSLNPA